MATDYFVDSAGVRLAVRDFGGDGPPVVLIHGHYGNLATFDALGPLLAKKQRVVAFDQRGHGWSEQGPVSLEAFVSDLDAVIRAVGLEQPWLFGGSFGTLVALAYVEAGRPVAGLISEDGVAADFASTVHEQPAPPDGPAIVTADVFEQIVEMYRAAGSVGVASSERSAVRRADGGFEIRPSGAGLHAKESTFLHVRVLAAYRRCSGRALYLAAANEPAREDRREDLDALAALGVTVESFDTGHWISAADPSGVAQAVTLFIADRP